MILSRAEVLKKAFKALSQIRASIDRFGQRLEAWRQDFIISENGRAGRPQSLQRLQKQCACLRPKRDVTHDECRHSESLPLERICLEILRVRSRLSLR